MSGNEGVGQEVHTTKADPTWLPAYEAWASGVDVVLAVNHDGLVMRSSRSLAAVPAGQLTTQPIWELTSDANRAKLRAAVQHAFHPGLTQVLEADFAGSKGRHWFRIQSIPSGEPGDEIALLHCLDIDTRRREIERLQEGERMMRDSEGLAHLGTWYWDITEPHATWSEGLYHIYGLDPKTHTPTYEDYLTRIHVDDVERVKYATERVFKDFESYSHDERIRHTDGTWRHLHTWARPVLKDDGTLAALQGVCLDITQRKESEMALAAAEARQRLILDYAGLGIASIEADGRVQQANATFDQLTGLDAGVSDRFQEPVEVDAALNELMAGKAKSRTVGARPKAFEGRHVRLLLTRVDEEAHPFVVAVAQDVTAEALALEADAKIRELEARQATQARAVGVAGHEIKNPITPILMQLGLLEAGKLGALDDRQITAVAKIHSQTERIQTLLQDLLDTARADAGELPLAKVQTDVAELVHNATDTHQATASSFNVILVAHGPDHLWAQVDAGRMVQVVDNLVINAIRFTPSGRRVDVTVKDQGSAWTLEVADEGVGIPLDEQANIFDAYVSGDTPAPHDLKSNGLGLFVVRAIVEAHGGTIGLKSAPGRGTTVTATLPK